MDPRFLIYLVLLLILVIYGAINVKRLSLPFRLLSVLVLITLIGESMTWSGIFKVENPLVLYHLLLPVTMFMLWLIFSRLMKKKQKIDFIITIVFIFFSVYNSIWHQYQSEVFPSHGLTLLCNLAIWLSLKLFKDMILLPTSVDIVKQSVFWLAISTLFFYSITFFAFTFFNLYSVVPWLQDVKYFAGLIFYTGYLVALYFDANRNKYNYEN